MDDDDVDDDVDDDDDDDARSAPKQQHNGQQGTRRIDFVELTKTKVRIVNRNEAFKDSVRHQFVWYDPSTLGWFLFGTKW